MSRFTDRFRTQRAAARRARAIDRALSRATSPALREELVSIANRLM